MKTRIVAASLAALVLSTGVNQAQAPLEFEVASIKRKQVAPSVMSSARQLPDGTVIANDTTIRGILGLGWPSEDGQYLNLPQWAERDFYDITVKPPAGATPDQIEQMWRTLFKQRLKLDAHHEMRDTPIFALVVARADGKLGAQLKPSPHDCAAEAARPALTPATATEEKVSASCNYLFTPGRAVSGGVQMSAFARSLRARVRRTVEDRTGLQGYWAFTLTYSPTLDPDATPAPGDLPSIFTALNEQLGLKLEPAQKQMRTVVVDHIERPTEN